MVDNITAIFCEDIREELSGKYSASGIFTNGITPDSYPILLSFSLLISVRNAPPENQKLKIKITSPKKLPVEMEFDITISDIGSATFSLNNIQQELTEPGVLKIEAAINDENLLEIVNLPLDKNS